MRTILLVDGYNVINQDNSLRKLPLEIARDKLFDRLIDYTGFKQYEFLLVFDAHMQSTPESSDHDGKVIYTQSGETADNYIEKTVRLIYDSEEEMHIIVATSDGLEQVMIMGYAERMSSRELIDDIKATRSKAMKKSGRDEITRRNNLEDRLTESQKKLFEKMRRGHIIDEKR